MNYLAEYKKNLRVRNYSGHTIAHYISDLNLLKRFTGKPWKDIKKEDVANFVGNQVKRKFSPKTINRRLSAIKKFFEYLSEELDWKIKNPVRSSQFVRSGRRLPRTLDNEAIEKFLGVITDARDQAIFSLMLRCGLRVSEVAELGLENVNLFRRELRIIGKGRKERIVPIPSKLFELLLACIKIRPNNPKFFWTKNNHNSH